MLHLSDLHLRIGAGPHTDPARPNAAWRRRAREEAWTVTLAEIRKDGRWVALVVCTVDRDHAGPPGSDPRALTVVRATCDALDVPLERLFVIPGDHDVDRKILRPAWDALRREAVGVPPAGSMSMAGADRGALRGDDRIDRTLDGQPAYWRLVTAPQRPGRSGPARPDRMSPRSSHGHLGYWRTVVLAGLSLPLHGGRFDGDHGQLWLTEHPVSWMPTDDAGAPLPGFRVAILRHGFAELVDGGEVRQWMADRVDLLHHGHPHEPASEALVGPDHPRRVPASGDRPGADAGHHRSTVYQVIERMLDERARPVSAGSQCHGWFDRGLGKSDAAVRDDAAPGGLWLPRGARGWQLTDGGDATPGDTRAPVLGEAPRQSRLPGWRSFKTLRDKLVARMVGRERELAQLDEWLLGAANVQWVVVTGGAGMGKSTILAAWLAQREATGAWVPHHFIVRDHARSDQPTVIAESLAAQIEAAFPDLRDPDATPGLRLIELLERVAPRLDASGRLIIVVDGLDETHAGSGDNPLPRFLPTLIPAGIRFLCSTRPTYPYLSWLVSRTPVRRIDLDDPQWAESNRAAVAAFWHAAAGEYEPPLPSSAIASAIAHAEGNLLHAVMLHDAWQARPAPERRIDRIPHGLQELIAEIWDRATAHDEHARVGLGLLCAAQEALPVDVLAEIAGWDHDERLRVLRKARHLLLEEPAAWAGIEAYRPRHGWVRELMAARLGASTMRDHHRVLSGTLAQWPAPDDSVVRRYALRHAVTHRVAAGDRVGAWRLAADASFLEARCQELGVATVEADMARLATSLRASGDATLGRRAEELARAVARESHWLRAAPEATTALVWNRLRRWGWSDAELEQQLRVPNRIAFLRLRHATSRDSPALVRSLKGHAHWVLACAVTPDGRHVVSASADRTLKLWELATGRALATLEGHTRAVRACAVTQDGRHVVSASEDQTLRVWELASTRTLSVLRGHLHWVTACAVTPDGTSVVSASMDQTLKVWELATGRTLAKLVGHTHWVTACAVTPDGTSVVSASMDQTLKVWELATGRTLATLVGHTKGVTACTVTPDGGHVVSASLDQTLKVWELATGRTLATLHGHTDYLTACTVTSDGERVVSASLDQALKVWELATGRTLATLTGHAHQVSSCAVAPDGEYVISASYDSTLKVWRLATGRARAAVEDSSDDVAVGAMSPGAADVVSAADLTFEPWRPASESSGGSPADHADRTAAHALTPDGRRFASTDPAFEIRKPRGPRRVSLAGHTDRVIACAVTPGGLHAVSASADLTLNVWDLATGRAVVTLAGHTDWVNACAVTPDGRHVVSASSDRTLKIWELATGRAFTTLPSHGDRVTACAVTPDGRRVVSASLDKTLRLWDVARHALREGPTLAGHTDSVRACAVTPDGRRVVSASRDGTLKTWDLATGRALVTFAGHSSVVTACAVTPDGGRVISASDDHTLKVWDLATGQIVATLAGHTSMVLACAVTPDGRHAISASWDETIKLWDLATFTCRFTHRGDAPYFAVAVTPAAIVAGDGAGGVCVLDLPSRDRSPGHPSARERSDQPTPSTPASRFTTPGITRHTILFLAANPFDTDRLALGEEARAIQDELERSGHRDRFELVTRWAVQPLDLLRELRRLRPTVVHFSGHGGPGGQRQHGFWRAPDRDIVDGDGLDRERRGGLYLQGRDGRAQWVSTQALQETFDAIGSSISVVVLNACHTVEQAEALLPHVDCVVGMRSAMRDDAARSFAIGFYGGLGEGEPIAAAYRQGCAAIRLEGLPDADRPQLMVRAGIDAEHLVLIADRAGASPEARER